MLSVFRRRGFHAELCRQTALHGGAVRGGGWDAVSAAQAAGADVETGSTLQGEIRDLHRNTLFFTPIRTLSNPDLTNRDLIKKNSSRCADTICIIEKKVKKQKSE